MARANLLRVGLVRKVAPADREKFEDIFACIDGALHLNYAKFGQSLHSLACRARYQVVACSFCDTLFPAGFCPVDEILEKSDGMSSSTSTSGEEGLNLLEPSVKSLEIARLEPTCLGQVALCGLLGASFRPVSLQDQRLSEGNHFLMTTPVRVSWDFFDEHALNLDGKTHYDQFADDSGYAPRFCNETLGPQARPGMTRTSGYFLGEKIDEITGRLVNRVIGNLNLKRPLQKFGSSRVEPNHPTSRIKSQ